MPSEEQNQHKTPFQKVTDDLTRGCGCACHTGTGPALRRLLPRDAKVARLEEQLEATRDVLRQILTNGTRCGQHPFLQFDEQGEIPCPYCLVDQFLAGSNPAIKQPCECGHSEQSHHGEDMVVARRPCRATVYTEAPLGGGNAFTCHCQDYVPASGSDS